MRTGRPKAPLILTDDERRRLDSLAHRSRSAPALARRAGIILACAEGTDSKLVARRVRVTPGTVCKWRGRFVTNRVEGLYDEPRPGATRTITDDEGGFAVVFERAVVDGQRLTHAAARNRCARSADAASIPSRSTSTWATSSFPPQDPAGAATMASADVNLPTPASPASRIVCGTRFPRIAFVSASRRRA